MNRSTERDFDQRIADWLEDDPNLAPRQTLDTVLAAFPSIPQRRTWRAPRRFRTMNTPLRLAMAAVIGVLVVGGAFYLSRSTAPSIGTPLASPSNGPSPATASPSLTASAWAATADMAEARTDFAMVLLQDGKVLAVGGQQPGRSLASAELYDPTTGSWTTAGTMSHARSFPTAIRLNSGKVLVAGGAGDTVGATKADLYDPATNTWTAAGDMTEIRGQHAAVLLSDGRVLVLGGNQGDQVPGTAELYDPTKGTWTATGNMTMLRASPSATLLDDGRVLVAGGFGKDGASAELYDPATGTWAATGSMAQARADGQTATRLQDGRVLVTGDPSSAAELFDPAVGTWTSARDLSVAQPGRSATLLTPGQTATLLADGRVLLAGGLGADGNGATSAQIYKPGRASGLGAGPGFWTSIEPMPKGRISGQAVRLPDDRVLVVGGYPGTTASGFNDGAGALKSTFIYDPATP
ncbi:MAG: kelch repeat-containing protein [Chloroflexota bacterium]